MRLGEHLSSTEGLAIASLVLFAVAVGGPSFWHGWVHKLPSIAAPETVADTQSSPSDFVLTTDDIDQLQRLCGLAHPPESEMSLCARAAKYRAPAEAPAK
jgi:hypothetical protein